MLKEMTAEEVIDRAFADIARQAFCLWTCELFKGGIIAVVTDKHLFERPIKFTDPLRIAAEHPVFTVAELNYLADKTDWTQRMVCEAKSLAPCWITLKDEEV